MKITGIYQLINPHASFNVYKVAAKIEIAINFIIILYLCSSSYFYQDNTNELMSHFMLVVAVFFATIKILYVSRNSELIWNNMNMTSINFLSYKGHNKEILQIARAKSISTTIIFLILWSSVVVAWSLSPYVVKDVYFNVQFKDEIRRYRYNSFNNVYPISEKFYNEHFIYFYVIEMTQVLFWGHSTIAYDTYVISVCISIVFQLKTIADSYSNLNHIKGKLYSN